MTLIQTSYEYNWWLQANYAYSLGIPFSWLPVKQLSEFPEF